MHLHIGRPQIQVHGVNREDALEAFPAQGGHRHRRLLQGFLAFARGNDDFFQCGRLLFLPVNRWRDRRLPDESQNYAEY